MALTVEQSENIESMVETQLDTLTANFTDAERRDITAFIYAAADTAMTPELTALITAKPNSALLFTTLNNLRAFYTLEPQQKNQLEGIGLILETDADQATWRNDFATMLNLLIHQRYERQRESARTESAAQTATQAAASAPIQVREVQTVLVQQANPIPLPLSAADFELLKKSPQLMLSSNLLERATPQQWFELALLNPDIASTLLLRENARSQLTHDQQLALAKKYPATAVWYLQRLLAIDAAAATATTENDLSLIDLTFMLTHSHYDAFFRQNNDCKLHFVIELLKTADVLTSAQWSEVLYYITFLETVVANTKITDWTGFTHDQQLQFFLRHELSSPIIAARLIELQAPFSAEEKALQLIQVRSQRRSLLHTLAPTLLVDIAQLTPDTRRNYLSLFSPAALVQWVINEPAVLGQWITRNELLTHAASIGTAFPFIDILPLLKLYGDLRIKSLDTLAKKCEPTQEKLNTNPDLRELVEYLATNGAVDTSVNFCFFSQFNLLTRDQVIRYLQNNPALLARLGNEPEKFLAKYGLCEFVVTNPQWVIHLPPRALIEFYANPEKYHLNEPALRILGTQIAKSTTAMKAYFTALSTAGNRMAFNELLTKSRAHALFASYYKMLDKMYNSEVTADRLRSITYPTLDQEVATLAAALAAGRPRPEQAKLFERYQTLCQQIECEGKWSQALAERVEFISVPLPSLLDMAFEFHDDVFIDKVLTMLPAYEVAKLADKAINSPNPIESARLAAFRKRVHEETGFWQILCYLEQKSLEVGAEDRYGERIRNYADLMVALRRDGANYGDIIEAQPRVSVKSIPVVTSALRYFFSAEVTGSKDTYHQLRNQLKDIPAACFARRLEEHYGHLAQNPRKAAHVNALWAAVRQVENAQRSSSSATATSSVMTTTGTDSLLDTRKHW